MDLGADRAQAGRVREGVQCGIGHLTEGTGAAPTGGGLAEVSRWANWGACRVVGPAGEVLIPFVPGVASLQQAPT